MMRIATWNVAYGIGKVANRRRLDQIQAVDADVWVLTETHDSLDLGPYFQAISSTQRSFGPRSVIDGSRWVTIWTRFRLIESDVEVSDRQRTTACIVEADGGALLVYGTVLPWTGDTERGGMAAELARQAPEWASLQERHGAGACLAGDFNVNLGGPHYYGSNESKAAVAARLEEAGLVAVTDFAHTEQHRRDFGIVDHIALSRNLARSASVNRIWGPKDEQGRTMSDHSGVSVDVPHNTRGSSADKEHAGQVWPGVDSEDAIG